MIDEGEEGQPAKDQQAADPFSTPSGDEADHHRQHGGEKQKLSQQQDERIREALTHGENDDEGQDRGADDAGSPTAWPCVFSQGMADHSPSSG